MALWKYQREVGDTQKWKEENGRNKVQSNEQGKNFGKTGLKTATNHIPRSISTFEKLKM